MKNKYVFLITIGFIMLNSGCNKANKDKPEDVWEVVEHRMATWAKIGKEGHYELYHPNYRRWSNGELINKDTFKEISNKENPDIEILNMEIIRNELLFFNDGHLAVAHYKLVEKMKYKGEDYTTNNDSFTKGETWEDKYVMSDYYVKENRNWLFLGGYIEYTDD